MEKETTKIRVVWRLHEAKWAEPKRLPLLRTTPQSFDLWSPSQISSSQGCTYRRYREGLLECWNRPRAPHLWFLWIDDILKDNPQLVVMRFARVVFGVNSSPFLLNATIRHHLSFYASSDPDFMEDVLRSLYVDNLASSRPNGASAYEFYLKLKSSMHFSAWYRLQKHSKIKGDCLILKPCRAIAFRDVLFVYLLMEWK